MSTRTGLQHRGRKAMLSTLGPQGLAVFLPRVMKVMTAHVAEWEAAGRMPSLFRAARRLGLDLSVDVVMGVELSPRVDRAWFKKQVETWLDGMFGLPLRFPGSTLSRAVAAKEALLAALMSEEEVVRDHQMSRDKWEAAQGNVSAVLEGMSRESPSGIIPLKHVQRMGLFGDGGSDLRDSAMSIMHGVFAAADTTRWALFNTLALVAMSPRVQEKVFQEQQQVISEHGSEMSLPALGAMSYLEAALKEAMRLLPATSGGLRQLTEPLKVGDTVLPAGSMIWLYSHLMHCLDPALWDGRTDYDVPPHMDWRHNFELAFRPERWLGGEGEAAPKYYFTFGTSSHLCAGKNLAYLEVKVMLAMLLRKHTLRLQTPDMLKRCRFFPFTIPPGGTDTLVLVPRQEPALAG
ncbi:hypothetical protein GPECTOR_1g76 [Gonium pectorale]|uniref:Cytochrome P450 n=1 Tax=Gonium pectorale TaxID=33097 RepID=A0A150H467_GONPE|nr:hypothetical protein GPECTOR_1g76 [Gonium pectorale]|eukprot:KXZ56842.1 hypothetical protein GPECTOR_1g76 [Gonium pectorale]